MKYLLNLAVLALVAFSADDTHNPHWAQWRGPNGQGIATGAYQDTWSPTENIAWKSAIPGRGHLRFGASVSRCQPCSLN